MSDEIPNDITDIFKARKEKVIYSRFTYKGVDIACHFFSVEEVEFDVSPREINKITEAKAVFEFMDKLSGLL
ncbi:hypothetical protein [Ammoniphilus sp. 3BR4]|uniref:hypothetical protein n=1 Tax=Ammoniphilus sp. 3BR4 TaxID=3158265 RepID=UPI003464F101